MGLVAYRQEELELLCKNTNSCKDILLKTGRTLYSGNYKTLYKYIQLYNIDFSHFIDKDKINNYINEIKMLPPTRICTKCGQEKDTFKDFYLNQNKIRSICKECEQKRAKEKHHQIKEQIINYKKEQGCCQKCGEKRSYTFDFHHRNPEEKEFEISKITTTNIENIKEEIDKCDILCANCHREWHYLFPNGTIEDYNNWLKENKK